MHQYLRAAGKRKVWYVPDGKRYPHRCRQGRGEGDYFLVAILVIMYSEQRVYCPEAQLTGFVHPSIAWVGHYWIDIVHHFNFKTGSNMTDPGGQNDWIKTWLVVDVSVSTAGCTAMRHVTTSSTPETEYWQMNTRRWKISSRISRAEERARQLPSLERSDKNERAPLCQENGDLRVMI